MVVEVKGLDPASLAVAGRWAPDAPEWGRLLSVHVAPANAGAPLALDASPMMGTYSVEADAVRFRPLFPLDPGLAYRAVLHTNRTSRSGATDSDRPIIAKYQAPARPLAPATLVSHIYPSADVLPENLLKFYICFSSPMQRGNVYSYIHLEDPTGKRVELPFLELDEELWNPEMTRFTLYVDPGRIKRGVKPLVDMGPALEAGKQYRLRIDAAWRDAQNRPLKQESVKTFRVGPADRVSPDPGNWVVTPPARATRDALILRFPEPMERALAERLIRVIDDAGRPVRGDVTLADLERTWTFVPDAPWTPGRYAIVVEPTIEDLAGNNVGKLFDVDLVEAPTNPAEFRPTTLPFQPR